MWTKYPSENHQQIIHRLLDATDPLPALAGKCASGGRLNLLKALSPPIRLVPEASNGLARFSVYSDANRTCTIQASSDLRNWFPIATNTTSISGSFDFVDDSATNFNRHFYRAFSAP